MVSVGGATARAVETCPAVAAFGTGVDIAGGKFVLDLGVVHTLPDVAQLELLLAYELMAGIEIAPRGDRHVLGARATARNALVDAGAARQIDHVVIEGEGLAFFVFFKHQHGKLFVLLHDDGTVCLGQLGGITGCADHRFHGKLVEAQIQHHLNIL